MVDNCDKALAVKVTSMNAARICTKATKWSLAVPSLDFPAQSRYNFAINKNYCFPLDIFDDHSRFLIRIKPAISTANTVIPNFREAFFEFGMPDSVLSDNGAQFAGFRHGYTQFEKWLMDHGVLPVYGRIKHP